MQSWTAKLPFTGITSKAVQIRDESQLKSTWFISISSSNIGWPHWILIRDNKSITRRTFSRPTWFFLLYFNLFIIMIITILFCVSCCFRSRRNRNSLGNFTIHFMATIRRQHRCTALYCIKNIIMIGRFRIYRSLNPLQRNSGPLPFSPFFAS